MKKKDAYIPMILLWTEEQAMKGWLGRAMVSYGRRTIPTNYLFITVKQVTAL